MWLWIGITYVDFWLKRCFVWPFRIINGNEIYFPAKIFVADLSKNDGSMSMVPIQVRISWYHYYPTYPNLQFSDLYMDRWPQLILLGFFSDSYFRSLLNRKAYIWCVEPWLYSKNQVAKRHIFSKNRSFSLTERPA